MAMRVAGEAIDEREADGARISDETLLVLLNSSYGEQGFILPEAGGNADSQWEVLMDTEHAGAPAPSGENHAVGQTYTVTGRGLALFRRV